jgi:hypothetical protein
VGRVALLMVSPFSAGLPDAARSHGMRYLSKWAQWADRSVRPTLEAQDHGPQGLKPASLLVPGGTAEAVPFHKPFAGIQFSPWCPKWADPSE